MKTTIDIPDEVSVESDGFDVTVEGPNGTVERRLWYPNVSVTIEDDRVVIESSEENKKTKSTVGTFESHLSNAFHGVTEGWEYEMEVSYEHFPMQVRAEGDEFVIENFIGEKSERRCEILGETNVEVDGEVITLNGPDKEHVGQTAGNIRQTTRITDKDTRVFEDGIYITKKPEVSH